MPGPGRPRLGIYVGRAKDVTCPGDNVTFEVVLRDSQKCSLECIPELSFFKGGQPPWVVEGTWDLEDDDDGEIMVTVTKQDITGPKKDTDLVIQVSPGAGSLVFRSTTCKWTQPPPGKDPAEEKREQMARATVEAQAQQRELAARQEELQTMRAEQEANLKAEQDTLERMKEELDRQREESELAALEHARVREESEKTRAEIERRRRDLADMEELARKRAEEEAARARDLADMQQELARERQGVEQQAAQLEERASATKEGEEAHQKAVAEAETQRVEDEQLRCAQSENFSIMEAEMKQRAQQLYATEQALLQERQQIQRSRGQLAVVQSHVLSMLDGGGKAGGEAERGTVTTTHCLMEDDDAEDGAEATAEDASPSKKGRGSGEDVWNMDWAGLEAASLPATQEVAEDDAGADASVVAIPAD